MTAARLPANNNENKSQCSGAKADYRIPGSGRPKKFMDPELLSVHPSLY
jgi:hypothetical protein